jgi:DNA polymerase
MKTADSKSVSGARKRGTHVDERNALTRVLTSTHELPDAVNECRRCSLWKRATQAVPGEGKAPNGLMLVGEAPGDSEDLRGHPFVGPAGAMLDRALRDAGLNRNSVYVTNAVKHFKFEPRGKRRLHVKPNAAEIEACNFWLAQELRLVAPKVVIALGATAARALLGRSVTISQQRGAPVALSATAHLWVTIHPSYLLRIPDEARRHAEFDRFVNELRDAAQWANRH